jgi:hypothetical protein
MEGDSMLAPRQAVVPTLLAGLALALATAPAHAAGAGATTAQVAKQPVKQKRAGRKTSSGTRKPASRAAAVLSGTRRPGPRVGKLGDVYLRTTDHTLWGPKTRRGWGRPSSLRGREGPAGRRGDTGAPGRTGATGPAGPPGTPTLGAPIVVARVPEPGTIASHWDDATRSVVRDKVVDQEVLIPAGISMVELHMRAFVGGMLNFPHCELNGSGVQIVGGWEGGGSSYGVAASLHQQTARLYCYASVWFDAREGTVAGTEVIVYPAIAAPLPLPAPAVP